MVRVEDILFWILILVALGIAIWLAFGSPEFENSFLAVIIFVATSEILLWRFLFAIDKRSAVGFEKVKNRLENVENRLINIDSSIIKINKKLKIK